MKAEHARYCEKLAGERHLPKCPEAREEDLVEVDAEAVGKTVQVHQRAATAWEQMKAEAQREGVVLQLVSGFRSRARQEEVITRKLAVGRSIEEIMTANAPPGYSEHHTGRALDLATPGCRLLEEDFEHTPAFRWLTQRAGSFGFRLTYPRNNPQGYIYEPWHWYYLGDQESTP